MRYILLSIIFIFILMISYCNTDSNIDSKHNPKTETKLPKNAVPLNKAFDTKKDSCMFVLPQLKDLERNDGKEPIKLHAQSCGKCHQTIYKEWQQTTHSHALSDLQFQAEIAKKSSPKWQCLNCHIKIQNQREYEITHLVDGSLFKPVKKNNPGFDPVMKKDAITCATCHVRKDKAGKSYVIGPLGTGKAPHPVKKDSRFLRQRCFQCHNVPKPPSDETFLCYFVTGKEWREGPYGLIDPKNDRYKGKRDCVDCHMPTTERLIADNYKDLPKRKVHQHHWVGGGVPKTFEAYDTLLKRGFVTSFAADIKVPKKMIPGKKAQFHIVLKNTDINGHWLPTGDLERFIFVEAFIIDSSGKRISHSFQRIGQVWIGWDIDSPYKDDDRRLRPNEKRDWKLALKLPKDLKGAKLIVTALHIKLLPKTVAYIKTTPNIDEPYASKIKNMEDYYPMSSFIFKEEIQLEDGTRKAYTMKELIELSKKRKGKAQLKALKEVQELTTD